MSENEKENQNLNSNADSFDDEDDLWAIQADDNDNPTIDFDGFDEEQDKEKKQRETSPSSQGIDENQDIDIETDIEQKEIEIKQTESTEQKDKLMEDLTAKIEAETETETEDNEDQNNQPLQPLQPPIARNPKVEPVEESNNNEEQEQDNDMAKTLEELESEISNEISKTDMDGADSPDDQPLVSATIVEEEVELEPEPELEIESKSPREETPKQMPKEIQEIKVENDIEEITLQRSQSMTNPTSELQESLNQLVVTSLQSLEEKKANLEDTIAKLERRRDNIQQEMKTTFAGASQDLAIRVQGFKNYLVGSLQDLAVAAEQLELSSDNDDNWETEDSSSKQGAKEKEQQNNVPQFADQSFTKDRKEIRGLLDQYRLDPDYYGPAWQLRRTFEPIHAQKVSDWFFNQGGRGALTSMGSRLQNILIGSAIISVLSHLYGDRNRILILADTPEKLGEWRRGLQDCLGISRSDFGPNRGVILFETPTALIKKGDRIMEQDDVPLVIMDLDDDRVSLSLLKFPLWLAFAPDSPSFSDEYYY